MLPIIVLLIVVLIIGVIIAYIIEAKRLVKKQNRFVEREVLDSREIFEMYFASTGYNDKRVNYLWNRIADILHLEAGKLRPNDRFDVELAPVKGHFVEDELVDLEDFMRDECKVMSKVKPSLSLKTLDEFIRYLCEDAKANKTSHRISS